MKKLKIEGMVNDETYSIINDSIKGGLYNEVEMLNILSKIILKSMFDVELYTTIKEINN